MAGSQGSFEDRIGKFKAGDTLIQSWTDYDSGNPFITKGEITVFIGLVEAANTLVVNTEQDLKQARNGRRPLCFTLYDENTEVGILNPDCAEQRIIGVHTYLESLYPDGHSTVDLIKRILDRIKPDYQSTKVNKSFTLQPDETLEITSVIDSSTATNTGNTTLSWVETGTPGPPQEIAPKASTTIVAPSGRITVNNLGDKNNGRIKMVVKNDKTTLNSPSEKTFASIPGFLSEVITLIGGVDATYNPPDPNLEVAKLNDLHDAIEVANAAVATALDAYGTANRERKELYDGLNGMSDRIAMIKSYLASFPGKKKSEHYIEYSQAIKGT